MENSDYLFMIGCLKKIASNYSLRVYAFCLMPNHVHVLLSPTESNLYDAMRDLFSRYAMKFNKKYERKGHLFGGPYRQAVCLDDSYLLAASLYIHLNPVKAGLATDLLAYRWSSCRLYYQDDAPKSFINPDFVLGLLSGNKISSKERYRDLLKQGSGLEAAHVLEQEDAIEHFQSKLATMFPSIFKMVNKKRQIAKFLGIDLPGMEELERHLPAIASRSGEAGGD
jgi:putative transposase